jgi:glycosyltransferase involved in cell wall biosynthesis
VWCAKHSEYGSSLTIHQIHDKRDKKTRSIKENKRIMKRSNKSIEILRLIIRIGEANAAYNQFSLALADKQNITICTYFKSNVSPPANITLFEGDDSLKGFFRVLKAAFEEKEYDIIHAHHTPAALLLIVASIMYGKSMQSTVFTVHNSYHNQNFKIRNKLILILIFVLFKRVVCCSQASWESLPGFFKWLAGDRICVIQNGLDIDRVDRVAENNRGHIQKTNFTIAAVGRLIEIKNPLSTLKAFQQSVDKTSRLMFFGDGRLHDLLARESKKFGLEKRVVLTGLIQREKVYEHLMKADLFVSTSRGEGLPVAVLEAMACRCPVLLSDIPSHREIADGAGYIPIVQPDDIAGFAQEIDRFGRMSPLERSKIGEKCRKLVEARFNLANMLKGYEKVYAQLMHDEAPSSGDIG